MAAVRDSPEDAVDVRRLLHHEEEGLGAGAVQRDGLIEGRLLQHVAYSQRHLLGTEQVAGDALLKMALLGERAALWSAQTRIRHQVQVECCFTSTETVRTVREPRTATWTFTQLLSSG